MSNKNKKKKDEPTHTPELSVSDADKNAAKAKSEKDCIAGIIEEARKLMTNETHSVQQLLAFTRGLDKHGYFKKKD